MTRQSSNTRMNPSDIKYLHKIFYAFANFYGIIPLQVAFKLIDEYTKGRFSQKELLDFALNKNHEKYHFAIINPQEMYDDIKGDNPLDYEIVQESLYSIDIEE